MDNDNNSSSSNNFFSGFLLGFLVGSAVVFLLGTKKGKKLLKTISEKGLDNISNVLEEADKTADLEAHEEDGEVAPKREITVKETVEEKPKVRRYFRGISRRLN